jgi:hypothetical protein
MSVLRHGRANLKHSMSLSNINMIMNFANRFWVLDQLSVVKDVQVDFVVIRKDVSLNLLSQRLKSLQMTAASWC